MKSTDMEATGCESQRISQPPANGADDDMEEDRQHHSGLLGLWSYFPQRETMDVGPLSGRYSLWWKKGSRDQLGGLKSSPPIQVLGCCLLIKCYFLPLFRNSS